MFQTLILKVVLHPSEAFLHLRLPNGVGQDVRSVVNARNVFTSTPQLWMAPGAQSCQVLRWLTFPGPVRSNTPST